MTRMVEEGGVDWYQVRPLLPRVLVVNSRENGLTLVNHAFILLIRIHARWF